MAALEKFVVDHSPADDNFCAPQTDAFDLPPFLHRQACQPLGDSSHLRAGDDCALAAPVLPQMAGGGGQRGGGSRGGNYILNPCRHDASRDAVYFAGDKALQPLEFALAWRIMPQEFIGESYRPQWQTHGVADLAASGYREFATATSQINHQCRRTIHAKIRDQSEMD